MKLKENRFPLLSFWSWQGTHLWDAGRKLRSFSHFYTKFCTVVVLFKYGLKNCKTNSKVSYLQDIYIDLILKTIVVLVFTRSLAYLNGNATSHRHSKFKYWSIYGTFLKSWDRAKKIKLLLQHFHEQTKARRLFFMEKYASKHV